MVGHITPEAYEGGVIGLLQNGDRICIDITQNSITVDLSDEELADRRKKWKRPEGPALTGILKKFRRSVASASEGCVTDA